jgi:hypothetical protein
MSKVNASVVHGGLILTVGLLLWSGCRHPAKPSDVSSPKVIPAHAGQTTKPLGGSDSVQKPEEVFFIIDHPATGGTIEYAWRKGLTVLRALSIAGGWTDWHSQTAKLLRSNGEAYTITLREAQKNPALDLPICPNDRIYWIRKSPFGF